MKQLRQLTSVIVISLFIWMPVQAANAATLDDVVNQIIALQGTVKNSISNAVKTFTDLMYQDNPSLGKTMAGNITQSKVNEKADINSQILAEEKVKAQLTGASSNFWKDLADLKASDTMAAKKSYADIFGSKEKELNYDPSMNANTILSPETYTPEQEKMAKYFALFAGDFGDPLPKISLRGLTQTQRLDLQDNDPNFRKFLVAKRTLIANRSVGLGNIYQLIANRTPVNGLGENAGLGNKPISAAALQDYLATRRANDAQWYEDMTKSSPSTIQRESLNVLVEMQKQLLQLHKDNERLLLTLSLMQLQGTQMSRALMKGNEETIKQTIKQIRKTGKFSPSRSPEARARELTNQPEESP